MQVDAQHYLDLVEKTQQLVCWDTESQGLEGDYGRLYVVSIKPFGRDPITLSVGANGQDKGLAKEARDILNSYPMWVTYYGKGHDIHLLNTRLIRWGYEPLRPANHADMYYQLKYKLKTGRHSQAHLIEFLEDTMVAMGIEPERKMTISPNVWSDLFTHFNKNIRLLRERCDSDTRGLEALYRTTRHLIRDIVRG